ncbi:Gfo/Idh/MocA family protein [Actinocatenispora rupis]|uniref:Oxidoreductase n=1 Tax=Actinocatenispora rupis TaxID=519421 RepID=A0A8J3NBK6_9ACTN|nr:Gfo/Idh/MocA family oxidoreductase [Actinocatenispora rupis]GID10762.1 oxidoreductase [Actinocatenispora rupis]
MDSLQIGALGAARITPQALIRPARSVPEAAVVAVAARDRARADAFATRHGVPVVHADYAALVDDPALDAVYVPLPNSLHAEWTVRAIEAGKHVLCEKPFTANAEEAQRVADAAAASDRVVMEAFHYRYHPVVDRALDLLAAGTIGTVRRVEARMCFPLPRRGDIRFRADLAGGATMDAGCYALHCLRTLGPGEPTVVAARARLRASDVDRAMTALLRYPNGATGRMTCSLWSSDVLGVSCVVHGDAGRLRITNYVAPQYWHRLSVRTATRRWHERVAGEASYTHQLRAFTTAALHGGPVLTPASDAVRTMRLIDDVYRHAGLHPR